jgi:hypothetical protein
MAAGKDLADFIDFVGHDGSDWSSITSHPEHREGFSTWEVIAYLASHEIMFGTFAQAVGEKKGETFGVTGESTIKLHLSMNKPAIVAVKSEKMHPNTRHVIFWSGEKVYDPNPDTEKVGIDDYEIYEWYPLLYRWK